MHSCNASERVIDAVWRLDASLSAASINNAINSLSIETKFKLQEMGQSFLVGYTLDNYDVAFKHSTGVVDEPLSSLVHLTSGLILKLVHASVSDLKYSTFLWERSKFNDTRKYALPAYTPSRLFELHAQKATGDFLTHTEDFARWRFAVDLCMYGPVYFAQFRDLIPEHIAVEKIPLSTTESAPLRSMKLQNSTVDGNIEAIIDSMTQTGVWEIADLEKYLKLSGIEEIVIFFHGDLGTWERFHSAQIRRSIERSSRERLQFIIFLPGLFHVKMACADAIWRIFISPSKLREDKTCMLAFIKLFYPTLTQKIVSNKAGFHVLDDCIVRTGVSDRLECWRIYAQNKWPDCDTLEKFAEKKPSLQDILTISKDLALKYASPKQNLENVKFGDPSRMHIRDYQYENTLIRIDYILLYEHLAHSIRSGDVGGVEICLRRWIPIFKGTGKHKYAGSLLEFLTDVHFVYPEDLKKAVRYNWLCNPSGKPMGFRGVDWLLERNNLLTKVVYGGSGSNYTVNRIIKESVLIQLYRDCKSIIEHEYILTPKTMKHGDPNLTQTFAALSRLARMESILQKNPEGRLSNFPIPNHFGLGMTKFHSEGVKSGIDTLSLLEEDGNEEVTELDLIVEES